MGRVLRVDAGGLVYHVLNRASARAKLFEGLADYQQFEQVLAEARSRTGMRLLTYCVMPNHWHLVLWPEADGTLRRFMTWLTLTHTQRWHASHASAGSGHLYQGRDRSWLVQADDHLLAVCRYVERNPQRARLVRRAEAWRCDHAISAGGTTASCAAAGAARSAAHVGCPLRTSTHASGSPPGKLTGPGGRRIIGPARNGRSARRCPNGCPMPWSAA